MRVVLMIIALGAAAALLGCGKKEPDRGKAASAEVRKDLEFGREAARFELWNEAIFRWERVLEQEPENAQAMNNLAIAYESVGNYERAKELYQQAIRRAEDDDEIRLNYKRFMSFYKKHQRRLERDDAAKKEEDER